MIFNTIHTRFYNEKIYNKINTKCAAWAAYNVILRFLLRGYNLWGVSIVIQNQLFSSLEFSSICFTLSTHCCLIWATQNMLNGNQMSTASW
jgi:hypothetical protein